MNEDATLLEELLPTKSAGRYCSLCNAEIPAEWDNDEHFGTCPACKRVNNFITGVEERDTWEKEEKERREKNRLMDPYGVYQIDKNGGKTGKIVLPNLAQLIMNEHNYYFLTVKDNQEIFRYNGSYYVPDGEQIIRNKVEYYLGEDTKEHYKNEVVGFVRDANYVDRNIFTQNVNFINLKNGIYDIDKKEIKPHSPDYHFLNEMPVDYIADARCDVFEKFMKHICMSNLNERPQIEKTLQEYMGYMLYRAYPYKKYLVLDGGGDNAKTQFVIVCKRLVGHENNTGVSLQELNGRPFAKSQLFGKHTNISDDLPKKGVKYTGVIKQITGNSPIWADIKNHKKGINFTNYAKPIYACNELPEVEDLSDAFFSRQLQITLLNRYIEEGEGEIDDKTTFLCTPDIAKNQLAIPENMPGILNYALSGLHRLIENSGFSYRETTEKKRETWLRKTNPIRALMEDEIETTNEDWAITVDDFFKEILSYCERNGFDRPTRHKVTSKMKDEGIRKQQKTIDGQPRVWCWVGIRSATDNVINHYIGKKVDGKQQHID